jgi:hypothetical protein
MFGKNLILGRAITRLAQTPWKLDGKTGSSCDCFLQLDGQLWVQVGFQELVVVSGPLPDLIPAETLGESPARFLGHFIRQVAVSTQTENLLVVLRHGLYLENDRALPGGNRWYLGSFEDWSDEDKDEPFVDYWDRTPARPWAP